MVLYFTTPPVNFHSYHDNQAQLPNEPYVIIVTSTHGEGEPPDTAKAFYKHLGSELPPTHLEKVNYTV